MTQQTKSPVPGILIGITHTKDFVPVIREPRVLRVGIGVPKGRACYIYTHQGLWFIRYGSKDADKDGKNAGKFKMLTAKNAKGGAGFSTRKEAEDWYNANNKSFLISEYPQRLPFFTFTRRMVDDKVESFVPDFDAIEAHGDTPRELDIVFMGENPLFQEYQAWSATELKCHGDGLNALRVISMGNEQWPGWDEAKAASQKYFPISDECFTCGCPYAQEGGSDKLQCKPMTTLSFQLANSIRLGATAYFSSTGIETAKSLFSSLDIIRSLAQRVGSGITNTPLKLTLRAFKTKKGVQYAAGLEFRAKDAQTLRTLLMESAWKPNTEMRQIAAVEEEPPEQSADAVTAEFFPDAGVDAEPDYEETQETVTPAAEATAKKSDALTEKLAKERAKSEEKSAVPAAAPATAATAPVPAPSTSARTFADWVAMPVTDLEDIESEDERWRGRTVRIFAELGEPEVLAIIHGVTGGGLESVTAYSKNLIWKGLEAAKKKATDAMVQGAKPGNALF